MEGESSPKDKVILITGGVQGIGYSIVEHFLQKDAKLIIIIDIDEKLGLQAAQDMNTKYGENKCDFIKCDITNDLEDTWKYIIERYTYVDVLVNSAGMANERDERRVVDVNLTSLITLSLKFWHQMRKDKSGKGGTIINISSIWGFRSQPFTPIYAATKFGVLGFSKSLGHNNNYSRTGIRVIALCPGFTDTNILKNSILFDDPQLLKEFEIFRETKVKLQNVEVVGNAAMEIFHRADSGTAWLIEESGPVIEIV